MSSPEDRFRAILADLGFAGDPQLADTPSAFLELLREFTGGDTPPQPALIACEARDLVVVRDISFHSLCAHHLVPFFGTIDIAYVPDRNLAGLGWFPRIVEHHSRRLQLQERLVSQLTDSIESGLAPRSLGVRLRARQMCMELRGARSMATTESFAVRGVASPELTAALQSG